MRKKSMIMILHVSLMMILSVKTKGKKQQFLMMTQYNQSLWETNTCALIQCDTTSCFKSTLKTLLANSYSAHCNSITNKANVLYNT